MNRRSPLHRAVGYAAVPDFHVAVARRADPSLSDRPVVVGGDPEKRGKVVAASPDLRALGLSVGMPVREVLDRAPDAIWVQTDMAQAREVSGLFRAAIRQELEAIELDGLGAVYWEASEDEAESRACAKRIQLRVREATGLPLSVGVAPVRFAARWAAEDAGADSVRMVSGADLDAYLLGQPIERFPGVGPKTAARLADLGASDVLSLRGLGLERLELLLGNHGRSLFMLACGDDPKPLRAKRHPATLSREKSFSETTVDRPQVVASLERLAHSLADALLREGLGAGRIAMRLTLGDSRTLTRSTTLPHPITTASQLSSAAHELLMRAEAESETVRKLGLIVAGLEIQGASERQLGLF